MASKKKVEKETASWAGGIEKYSRQIWLAGLGAYAKTAADGGKLFDSLVKEGERAEKQAKGEIDKQVNTVKAVARPKAGGLKEKALGKWGELEEAFDQRLNSAISRLGVPSRNEVAALHDKVDVLMRELERLTGTAAPQPQASLQAPPQAAAKPLASATRRAASPTASSAKPVTAKASASVPGKATAKSAIAKPTAAKPASAKVAGKSAAEASSKVKAAPTEKKPRARKAAASSPTAAATPEPSSQA
ncbi:phasin family protein [Pseudomonas sp. RIT-PI-S]|uniref:phasin family protein n=1 Tax=Pseudomonas sp. RIT-PI-S TaxID=3035295 RepID=UPI0021DAD4C3|nr:phasin family protein [Pseudomonas sp. RIT-PI-S]